MKCHDILRGLKKYKSICQEELSRRSVIDSLLKELEDLVDGNKFIPATQYPQKNIKVQEVIFQSDQEASGSRYYLVEKDALKQKDALKVMQKKRQFQRAKDWYRG